jgi:hypothetical protein
MASDVLALQIRHSDATLSPRRQDFKVPLRDPSQPSQKATAWQATSPDDVVPFVVFVR